MPDINITEEQKLDIKDMQNLLEGFGKLDKNRKGLLLATLTGMNLAIEAERKIKEKAS